MKSTNGNATYWMPQPLKCVMCHGRDGLSIVWSVSYGTNHESAEQVVACKNCRKRCDTCGQERVEDEINSHYDSGTRLCDPCRCVMHIENDRFSRAGYYRKELARWRGADGPVAYSGAKLLTELKAVEKELAKRAR